jgi:2,5-diketo-D-gluconate reductase A
VQEDSFVATVPNVTLNNGVEIPQLGFGVFLLRPDETIGAVTSALKIGYRHIDTAQRYQNEKEVGVAIAQSGLQRSEVFLTSKLGNDRLGFDGALFGIDETLAALGIEQIDLFLIHWPLATVRDFVKTWQAFERIYTEGRARAIGVSNFHVGYLQRLFDETEIVPAVNQIETHPYLTQEALLAFDAEHGIATEAWPPLGRGAFLGDRQLVELATTYSKTPAQVTLRWHIQRDCIIFPKSVHAKRMRENFEIFDFELSTRDMKRISNLNRDERIGPNPETFSGIR